MSNIRSSERNSIIRNIKMDGFAIHQNMSEELNPEKTSSQLKTSLFVFLQKLEEKGFKDRLERGYLLIDRKGRLLPSYKSEIKNERSVVVAFWVSGEKYSDPSSLSQSLLKKVKSKLAAK